MVILRLEYDTPTGTFVSGQAVTGKVIVENLKPIEARFLRISVDGKARAGWTEKGQGRVVMRPGGRGPIFLSAKIKYRGEVDYLSKSAILWRASDEEKCLPAGTHAFPFAFPIPANCPPSCEGSHGSIRYYTDVELARPRKFNKELKRVFSVLPAKDLNTNRDAISGWVNSASKKVGFHRNALVSMTVNIPRAGYIAGEILPMTIDIENDSKSPVVAVRSKIMQYTYFHASSGGNIRADTHNGLKFKENCVAQSIMPVRMAPKSRGQVVHSIKIPNVVQSFECPVIEVFYKTHVYVDFASMYGKLTASLPLIIGTIPIRKATLPAVTPTASVLDDDGVSEASFCPIAPSAPPASLGRVRIIRRSSAPPSYEELMCGGQVEDPEDASDSPILYRL